jgi:hypothetical protein
MSSKQYLLFGDGMLRREYAFERLNGDKQRGGIAGGQIWQRIHFG